MTRPATLFFDLDGTLTDPRTGITTCIQHALEQLGIAPDPADDLTWCVGPPLRDSFVKLLPADSDPDLAVTYYRERFTDTGIFENTLYMDIPEALDTLRKRGHRMYLATSKPHVYAARILAHFGLDGFFDDVFGAELDGTRAHKGELLAHALIQTGAPPQGCIMIGDRQHDIIGARSNKMRTVGVLYGYGSRDELMEADAEHLVASPGALRDIIPAH